jgi:DNA polymerase-1
MFLREKKIAFDTEATGLNPWGDLKRWGYHPARPFAYSFSDLGGNTHFIRWQVDPSNRQVIIDKKDFPFLQDILEDERIGKIGHNISFDIRMSEMIGIKVRGKIYDTLAMAHLATGGGEINYTLKELSEKFLDYPKDDEDELLNDVKKKRNKLRRSGYALASEETHGKQAYKADMWLAEPALLQRYAVQDSERAALLFLLFRSDIEKDPALYEIFQNEMQLLRIVKDIEDRGLHIFKDELKELERFYTDYALKQQKIANLNGGQGMNFKSHVQMLKKFIEERGYKTPKFTKKGNPSLGGDFLLSISGKDKLAKAILEYRAAMDGLSNFVVPYKRFMVEENGLDILHPNLKQFGTKTGRFSAKDPNMMAAASEDSAKKKADISLAPRRCFGPRPGYIWYAPDYSQEEVWLVMFHAKDEKGMKFLLSGKSFHDELNKATWQTKEDFEDNKKSYKKKTKIIVFTKFYGGGKTKISGELNCTEQEASEFIDRINGQIPRVDEFMREKTSEARTNGFIRNSFGRIITIDPDLCYRAMNADIQGTAADIMKFAMVRLTKRFVKSWPGVQILLPIHDELIIEVPLKYHSKKLMRQIISDMQADSKRCGIPVPLPVSMKIMKFRWSKEIKLCDKHLNPQCKYCEAL